MEKSEGVVDGGMVLVPTDSTAVESDDDVNVIRHHVLLNDRRIERTCNFGKLLECMCLVVQHRVSGISTILSQIKPKRCRDAALGIY